MYCSFPGIQKPLDQYGPATADVSDSSPAKDAEDAAEDDDFDLFGSDDEEAVCNVCMCSTCNQSRLDYAKNNQWETVILSCGLSQSDGTACNCKQLCSFAVLKQMPQVYNVSMIHLYATNVLYLCTL